MALFWCVSFVSFRRRRYSVRVRFQNSSLIALAIWIRFSLYRMIYRLEIDSLRATIHNVELDVVFQIRNSVSMYRILFIFFSFRCLMAFRNLGLENLWQTFHFIGCKGRRLCSLNYAKNIRLIQEKTYTCTQKAKHSKAKQSETQTNICTYRYTFTKGSSYPMHATKRNAIALTTHSYSLIHTQCS